MTFIKLQFRPGIDREVTQYANGGGWTEGERVRFREGFPEQIGGWTLYPPENNYTFDGTCRALHAWVTLAGDKYLGLGTNLKYYIMAEQAVPFVSRNFFDITPIDRSATLANPFTATSGSSVLTVAHVAHGAAVGDYVSFSGAIGLGGNISADVLNQVYKVASVPTANTYTVDMAYVVNEVSQTPAVANATDAAGSPGGGAAVLASYEIKPDLTRARIWTHDNYGEDLLYNIRGGGIYYWDASAANPLQQHGVALSSLPGATATPTIANQILVSDRDRHTIAFGCDDEFTPGVQDPLLIRFSSQESLTDWASTATNTAGSLRLGAGSEIVCAVETRQQTLVFTDTSLYALQYVGPPYTFGVNMISDGLTISSPNAAVAVQDRVFWMGANGFYVYDGAVSDLPCTLKNDIFSEFALDRSLLSRVSSGVNSAFSEVWWFYPTYGSGDNARYVVYNYEQNIWYDGSMVRGAWLDQGIFEHPLATEMSRYQNTTGTLYAHEIGINAWDRVLGVQPMNSYIISSPIEIANGDQIMHVSRLVPDVDLSKSYAYPDENRYVTVGLGVQNWPQNRGFSTVDQRFYDEQNVSSPPYAGELFYRLRGRSLVFKLSNSVSGVFWRLGVPRVDVRTDGRRM